MSQQGMHRAGDDAPRSKRASRAFDVGTLAAGAVAAVLASACCLGPLLLVGLGVGGTWLANLRALEPYRPWFLGAALVALGLAWRRIFRPARCHPHDVCAQPTVRRAYKLVFFAVTGLIAIGLGFPYIAPFFY